MLRNTGEDLHEPRRHSAIHKRRIAGRRQDQHVVDALELLRHVRYLTTIMLIEHVGQVGVADNFSKENSQTIRIKSSENRKQVIAQIIAQKDVDFKDRNVANIDKLFDFTQRCSFPGLAWVK